MEGLPPFVSADWLAAHRDEVVVVDCRWSLDGSEGHEPYLESHVPGAINLPFADTLDGGRLRGDTVLRDRFVAARAGRRIASMLTLYHDIPSAGSLIAMLRLQSLADEGLAVAFRGFDVLGLETTLPATLDDLEDWEAHRDAAAELGWELPRPRHHPATLKAHLLGELAAERGLDAAWRLALYRAHWLDDADVSADSVLSVLAVRSGMDLEEVEPLLHDPEHRHRLRKRMLVHRGDGVGGVPVLEANGTFLSPFVPVDDLRMLAEL